MSGADQGVVTGGQPLPFASTGGASPMPVSYANSAGMPSEAPNLPGYAWPGYAAHPNYGAVSYPQQYSRIGMAIHRSILSLPTSSTGMA